MYKHKWEGSGLPHQYSVKIWSGMANRLALGTVQFGLRYGVANTSGQVSPDEVTAILQQARAAGVDTLDTAIASQVASSLDTDKMIVIRNNDKMHDVTVIIGPDFGERIQ